ncbi:MAG: methyltransferase [Gammaproteobacteria bacterium]|nr:MAG: methyltransferase [Gammaproteobacteria bacterium]
MQGLIQTKLTYITDQAGAQAIYNYRPGADDPDLSSQYVEPKYQNYDVEIKDIRSSEQTFCLDVQGLAVVNVDSALSDYYDEPQVRAVYMPEMEALVKNATGAARVFAFDYNVRCETYSEHKKYMAHKPVRFVHNDYTDESGPQRVIDLMGDEAGELLKRRFTIVNVWKPIVGPVLRTPLAVCDANSMGEKDFIDISLLYRDRIGQIQMVTHRPQHRWYYVANMQPNEALLLKCYDSEQDGRARFTAHTAFDDPNTLEGAPDRQSIEVRTLAFFD